MRASGFFIGSVVGAAAAVYFMRGGKFMMSTTMTKTSDSIGQAIGNGMAAINAMGMGGKNHHSHENEASASAKHGNSSMPDMGKINEMVNKDQTVKHQVDEILKENPEGEAATHSFR